jgi:glycosyltransferase involved in cell wall biosynthesis
MADPEVTIVIPCLNEQKTVGNVVDTALNAFATYGYEGEVIVADNGSTDGSQQIAIDRGARVVPVALRGYGSALTEGILSAAGRYVIVGDADESYDFMEINKFVPVLREGKDFVIGTRLQGVIEPGAMPSLHRYLGTPVLTTLINLFFGTKISDCNCGIRGIRKEAFRAMGVQSTGMEFASEMIIKAGLLNMKMAEVPVTLRVDKRDRRPHLNTWRDGWMHLRFILTFAADRIFFVPSLLMVALGLTGFVVLGRGPVVLNGVFMDYHYLFPSSLLIILGVQLLLFTFLTKTYTGLAGYNQKLQQILNQATFELLIIFGSIVFVIGLGMSVVVVIEWLQTYGKGLFAVRPLIISSTLMAAGLQICFNSFFMSVLKIPQHRIVE